MKMKDWSTKLHGFLELNDRDILSGAGKVSHELAIEIAEKQYEIYKMKSLSENIDEFDVMAEEIDISKKENLN